MRNSEHGYFGTCHIGTSTKRDCTTALFQVTMYMQFAWKVVSSVTRRVPVEREIINVYDVFEI